MTIPMVILGRNVSKLTIYLIRSNLAVCPPIAPAGSTGSKGTASRGGGRASIGIRSGIASTLLFLLPPKPKKTVTSKGVESPHSGQEEE